MDVLTILDLFHYKSKFNIKDFQKTLLFSSSKNRFKSVIIFSSILIKLGKVKTFITTTKTVKIAAIAIKNMLK